MILSNSRWINCKYIQLNPQLKSGGDWSSIWLSRSIFNSNFKFQFSVSIFNLNFQYQFQFYFSISNFNLQFRKTFYLPHNQYSNLSLLQSQLFRVCRCSSHVYLFFSDEAEFLLPSFLHLWQKFGAYQKFVHKFSRNQYL